MEQLQALLVKHAGSLWHSSLSGKAQTCQKPENIHIHNVLCKTKFTSMYFCSCFLMGLLKSKLKANVILEENAPRLKKNQPKLGLPATLLENAGRLKTVSLWSFLSVVWDDHGEYRKIPRAVLLPRVY